MSTEQLCSLHAAQADYLCLYHKIPMCAECKFAEQHKFCPKDSIGIKEEFPPSETERGHHYDQCVENYREALQLQTKSSDLQALSPAGVKDNLDSVFKEFKSRVNSLQEETEKCIDETKTTCVRKCTEIQSASSNILTEIGNHMKTLCDNSQDVTNIYHLTQQYQNIIESKRKELDTCDMEYMLSKKLACLLDPERILPFHQAVQTSQLIDSIYPPVADPKLQLVRELDAKLSSEKSASITGCAVLKSGMIALVDNASSFIKLYDAKSYNGTPLALESPPFDITEREEGFCVTFPKLSKIRHFTFSSDNTVKAKDIIDTRGKCFGIEYEGQKLVVSCHLSGYKLIGSLCWQFCVYRSDNQLLRVVENDRFGNSFSVANGYFDYCPIRDQILFLGNDGIAKKFHITGPSHLESPEVGSKKGEKILSLRSRGSTVILCQKKSEFLSSRCALLLHSTLHSAASSTETPVDDPGPMHFNMRSRVLLVTEKHQMFNDRGNTAYVYKF